MARARTRSAWFQALAIVAADLAWIKFGAMSEAKAATVKLQGVGEATLGVTDNAHASPNNPAPGIPPRASGMIGLLSPGLVLAFVSRQAIQHLSYSYAYNLVLSDTTVSTSSNQIGYHGFFDLSSRLGLVLGANAIQSNSFTSVVLTGPGAGAVNALPAGSGNFLAGTADELVSYDVSEGWRVYEGATIAEQTPIFDTVAPRTFATGGRLGAEARWITDAVGVEPRLDYAAISGSLRPDGTPAGEQRQIVATGVGIWRHDWGRDFASRVEAGALRAERLNTGYVFWEPTGSASLAYVTASGDAELSYGHTLTTNLLLGLSLLVDEVRLRGALPLTKKGEVLVGATTGYQKGRIFDEDGSLASHVDSLLVDAGVGWQTTSSLLLGLRYQHIEQMSDTTTPPLPLSFVRNTVMLSATFRYPPDDEMPRAYRGPRRVDRSDEVRDTTNPAATPERRGGTGT